jgi:hypothetical protein
MLEVQVGTKPSLEDVSQSLSGSKIVVNILPITIYPVNSVRPRSWQFSIGDPFPLITFRHPKEVLAWTAHYGIFIKYWNLDMEVKV